jgi:hypothetical protein
MEFLRSQRANLFILINEVLIGFQALRELKDPSRGHRSRDGIFRPLRKLSFPAVFELLFLLHEF